MPTPYINTFYATGTLYYVGYSDSTYVYIQQDGCQLYLTTNPDIANLYDVYKNLYVLDITLITTPVVASISELISLTPTSTTTITSGDVTGALGYIPENQSNKTDLMSGNTTSSVKYLSAKGVYDWVVAQAYLTASSLTGYATQVWVNAQGFITNVISSLGYTPENVSNKSDSYTASSSTTYASTKALVDGLASIPTPTIYKSTTTGTATSGTSNTISASQLITGNTFSVGDIIEIKARSIKTGTTGSMTLRIYTNTTSSLTGATLVATYPSNTGSNIYLQIERFLMIKSATNTQTATATGTLLSDTAVTSAQSALNIDWTTDKYIIFALQNGNAGDSSALNGYLINQL